MDLLKTIIIIIIITKPLTRLLWRHCTPWNCLKWGETSIAVFRHHVTLHPILSTKQIFANGKEPSHVNSSGAECRLSKWWNVAHLYKFEGHKILQLSTTTTTFLLFSSTTTTFVIFSSTTSKTVNKRLQTTIVSSVCRSVSSCQEQSWFSSTFSCLSSSSAPVSFTDSHSWPVIPGLIQCTWGIHSYPRRK